MADFPLGLSFDDVLLLPRLSAILPGDADISSQLVPGFDMKIPMLSAAMDTVSESELAIALAREGGLAVIHRNNPIDIQAAMVSRVKRFENAVIPNPVTVNKDMTLEEVHQIMMDQGYSGFPVVDANRKLEGIITGRDMRGVDDYQNVRVEDVMTPLPRLITAAPTTTIEEARHILYTHRIEKLPLVDEHGVLAGLITETDIQKRAMFADASKDEHGHLRCGAAVGVGPDYLDRAKALISAGADALFIDAATGHTTRVMDVVSNLRKLTDRPIVAGNVVTAEGAADLIKAGLSLEDAGRLMLGSWTGVVDGESVLIWFYAKDKVLISESCTHHRVEDDIGTVKIPRWLRQHVGGELVVDHSSGLTFPQNLSEYKLVLHCGACMTNRREMLARIVQVQQAGVPIVNYGVAIAALMGILHRALSPFPLLQEILDEDE